MEDLYKEYVFHGNFRTNATIIAIGAFIFLAYGALDYNLWGAEAFNLIIIRALGSIFGLILLSFLFLPGMSKHQEVITTLVSIGFGISLNAIVHYSSELAHAYYVALIQSSVLVCCLVQIGFAKSAFVMMTYIGGFALAAYSLEQNDEAGLQLLILISMCLILAFASYILQRYRRIDFVKTQIINNQNKQLRDLLSDIQSDHDRKVAAMNMLVHFVRTPLHQISGFSDVVLHTLASQNDKEELAPSLDGARYIKTASMDLTENVNRLLAYHRLDEHERGGDEPVDVVAALADHLETFEPRTVFEKPQKLESVTLKPHILDAAFQNLALYYSEPGRDITQIEAALQLKDEGVSIILKDDGASISQEEFENLTKPLTKIDKYLDVSAAKMPMLLRTVARAAEIMGGSFTCTEEDGRCVFHLYIRDEAHLNTDKPDDYDDLTTDLLPENLMAHQNSAAIN